LFATLAEHRVRFVVIGGIAAALHGSPVATVDADICPDASAKNLEQLCAALRDLHARLRTPGDPDGVDFPCHPALLAQMKSLTLTTDFGSFDLVFHPAGFENGYDDLAARASDVSIGATSVSVAALDDVIASKECANRPKDHAVLPVLYALRDEIAIRDD
jgi:hypothetical protein